MNRLRLGLGALMTAATLSGCSQNADPQPTTAVTTTPATVSATGTPAQAAAYAYEEGSKNKGDMGLCVVCVVNEGSNEEEVAAETLDYEGKTYLFCNESEKATFISAPAKFAVK
jgi:YHS domain-containing protein